MSGSEEAQDSLAARLSRLIGHGSTLNGGSEQWHLSAVVETQASVNRGSSRKVCELAKLDADIIDRTRTLWGRKTGRILSQEEAREILTNVTRFFQLLGEWDKKQCEDKDCDKTDQHGKKIA